MEQLPREIQQIILILALKYNLQIKEFDAIDAFYADPKISNLIVDKSDLAWGTVCEMLNLPY